jgi:phage host-nuclease inhibitor protein Gam
MVTRRKKPQGLVLADRDQANDTLQTVRLLEGRIKKAQEDAELEIQNVKNTLALEINPLKAELKECHTALLNWGEHSKDEICKQGRKSLRLPNGLVGFRKSTILKAVKGSTFASILALVVLKRLTSGYTTKHKLDKEALKKWDDEALESVGAVKTTGDTFFFETTSLDRDVEDAGEG